MEIINTQMNMNNPKELEGKRVKVRNTNQAGIKLEDYNKIFSIVKVNNYNNITIEGYPNNPLLLSEIEIMPYTEEEINNEISSYEKNILNFKEKIETLEMKKKFMKDNNLDFFSETEYKVFKTLETLENENISAIEKAKLISEMIKN